MGLTALTSYTARAMAAEQTGPQLLTAFTGDPASVEAIIRVYAPIVICVCRSHLRGDAALADDAAQATFVALFRNFEAIRDKTDAALRSWLHTTAVRACGHVRRTRHRQALLLGALAQQTHADRSLTMSTPSHDVATADTIRVLWEEIGRLPRKDRLVVEHWLASESQREVAETLGVSDAAVCKRLQAAKSLLGKRLARRGVTGLGVAAAFESMRASLTAALPQPVMAKMVSHCLAALNGATAAIPPAVLAAADAARGAKALLAASVGATLAALSLSAIGAVCLHAGEGRPPHRLGSAAEASSPRLLHSPAESPSSQGATQARPEMITTCTIKLDTRSLDSVVGLLRVKLATIDGNVIWEHTLQREKLNASGPVSYTLPVFRPRPQGPMKVFLDRVGLGSRQPGNGAWAFDFYLEVETDKKDRIRYSQDLIVISDREAYSFAADQSLGLALEPAQRILLGSDWTTSLPPLTSDTVTQKR